jgi:ADP-ribosylglycohydrolase
VLGCLLGGAVGDALGAPVEFLSLAKIRERFGQDGTREFAPSYGRLGAITDDTQMTLFTAEGCLSAVTRWTERGICHPPTVIYHAYLRWLRTQGVQRPEPPYLNDARSWLIDVEEFHRRRAPGNTCLSALESGRMGSLKDRINNSKGCGGVMRVAPIGLLRDIDAFQLGCEAAAITHGHPSGYIPSGGFALMIQELAMGRGMEDAVLVALERAAQEPEHEETTVLLRRALDEANSGASPTAERVEALGSGRKSSGNAPRATRARAGARACRPTRRVRAGDSSDAALIARCPTRLSSFAARCMCGRVRWT